MRRRRRPLVAVGFCGLLIASLLVVVPPVAGAESLAASSALQLLDQTFNVATDGLFSITVALPPAVAATDLSTATIDVAVYARISQRNEVGPLIHETLPPITDSVTIPSAAWVVPQAGQVKLDVPLESTTSTPTALDVTRAGLYPVTVTVRRSAVVVARLVTFLNRLGASTPDELDSLPVALAIGTTSGVHLDHDSTPSLDDTTLAEMSKLADALAASKMTATVRIQPAVLAGLQQLDGTVFARLQGLLAHHQLTAEPIWPLDPSAAAAANQAKLYASWIASGRNKLASIVSAPISRTAVFVDRPISADGAELRFNLGAELMVMPPPIYDSLSGSILAYTDYLAQLVPTTLPTSGALDIAVIDHQIADLLADSAITPKLAAIDAMAHLLALQQSIVADGGVAQRHAVVIGTADLGIPPAEALGALTELITTTPGLRATTLDEVALRTDRLLVNGEEQPVDLPTIDGVALGKRVFAEGGLNNEILDVASMLPADDPRPAEWQRLSALLPTTALDDDAAEQMVSDIDADLATIKASVRVPAAFTINLPGRISTVRIRFENTSNVALTFLAQLSATSGKLVFDKTPQTIRLLPLENRDVPFTVEARSNGTTGVSLDVFTPNNTPLVPTVPLKFRVNAVGVGNMLTIALIGLVLLWWAQNIRRTRRKRSIDPPATLPAS
jgi:hypothetical protein